MKGVSVMKEYSYFKVSVEEHIAVITISRPKALNALSTAVVTELETVIADVSEMDDVWVVIFTGDGDKAFVAGGDIKEMYVMDPDEGVAYSKLGTRVLYKIENMPQPTIAAVNGYALGGGTEIAMALISALPLTRRSSASRKPAWALSPALPAPSGSRAWWAREWPKCSSIPPCGSTRRRPSESALSRKWSPTRI